jgi:quercetin dioxygenase-like cupin family protein
VKLGKSRITDIHTPGRREFALKIHGALNTYEAQNGADCVFHTGSLPLNAREIQKPGFCAYRFGPIAILNPGLELQLGRTETNDALERSLKMIRTPLAALFCMMSLASIAQAESAVENKIVPEDQRAFFTVSDPIQFAVVTGDLQKGPQGTFGRFPGDFITPMHTHSHAYEAIVISGRMTNPFDGEENPPVMGPGSFWSVAAGAEHATACVSEEPCEFFMFASDGFDFEVAE